MYTSTDRYGTLCFTMLLLSMYSLLTPAESEPDQISAVQDDPPHEGEYTQLHNHVIVYSPTTVMLTVAYNMVVLEWHT